MSIKGVKRERTLRAKRDPDAVRVYGAALSMAWCKYRDAFGVAPRGTLEQMTALIELAGGEKVLKRVAAYAAARKKERK